MRLLQFGDSMLPDRHVRVLERARVGHPAGRRHRRGDAAHVRSCDDAAGRRVATASGCSTRIARRVRRRPRGRDGRRPGRSSSASSTRKPGRCPCAWAASSPRSRRAWAPPTTAAEWLAGIAGEADAGHVPGDARGRPGPAGRTGGGRLRDPPVRHGVHDPERRAPAHAGRPPRSPGHPVRGRRAGARRTTPRSSMRPSTRWRRSSRWSTSWPRSTSDRTSDCS